MKKIHLLKVTKHNKIIHKEIEIIKGNVYNYF